MLTVAVPIGFGFDCCPLVLMVGLDRASHWSREQSIASYDGEQASDFLVDNNLGGQTHTDNKMLGKLGNPD